MFAAPEVAFLPISTWCTCAQLPQPCQNLLIVGLLPARLLCLGFSRQEYWAGLPCPPPGDLPHPGIERASLLSPVLAVLFLLILPPGNPRATRQTTRDAFRETRKPRHVWWLDCPGGVALREVRQGDRARRAHTRVGLSGPKSYEWKQRRNMAARN